MCERIFVKILQMSKSISLNHLFIDWRGKHRVNSLIIQILAKILLLPDLH